MDQFNTQNVINRISNLLCLQNSAAKYRESAKPANDSRVSFVLFFSSKHLVFFLRFFSISLKPLSLAFLISHRFSAITGRYFHPCVIRFTLFNQKFMLEHLYYTWGYRKRKTCQEKTNMLNGYSFMIPLILWQST